MVRDGARAPPHHDVYFHFTLWRASTSRTASTILSSGAANCAGRVSRLAFRLGESADVPVDVSVFNRNLMNLLEMPLLFYVACLAFYVTRKVDPGVTRLAWSYVALRLVHSGFVLPKNETAFTGMSDGWKKVVPRIGAMAGEQD